MKQIDRILESRITGHLFSKASHLRVPLSGTFELSPICNFSCKMCYVRKTKQEVQKNSREMLTMQQWLEIARSAKEKGLLYLLLTGGEPLLWPDFWKLYEELSRMGFLISINTNGSLIDDEAIRRFRATPPAKINITLYGASDETYMSLCGVGNVFSKINHAIDELTKNKIPVKLNGTLTPQNIGDLESCAAYAKRKGLVYDTVTYMFPPLRRDASMIGINERFTPEEAARHNLESFRIRFGQEHYQNKLRAIENGAVSPLGLDENCVDLLDEKIRCRAGRASFWITWDGYITPCGMMPEPRVDLVENNFEDAWNQLVSNCDTLKLSSICGKCENKQLCHSCAAMAMAETGSTTGVPRYLCEMVQEMQRIAREELVCCK